MRFIIRLLSLPFLILALAALAVAVYLLVEGVEISLPAGQVWNDIDSNSLNLAQVVIERYVAPVIFYESIWFDLFVPMLVWPAWQAVLAVMFGAAAIGLLLWRIAGIGRRRPVD